MGLLIVADTPTVRVCASSAMGQSWLDRHINPLCEEWDRGYLVMSADQAAHLATRASFDRIDITYELK